MTLFLVSSLFPLSPSLFPSMAMLLSYLSPLSLCLSPTLSLTLYVSIYTHVRTSSHYPCCLFILQLYRDIVPHNPFESFGYRHVFREWYENNKGENITENKLVPLRFFNTCFSSLFFYLFISASHFSYSFSCHDFSASSFLFAFLLNVIFSIFILLLCHSVIYLLSLSLSLS